MSGMPLQARHVAWHLVLNLASRLALLNLP
jgi:hypothetical protein